MSRTLLTDLLLRCIFLAFGLVPTASWAQTGGLQVTLKNVNGVNSPISGPLGSPHFKLYTSPVKEVFGGNPSVFSNVQSGQAYWIEGYAKGTFWGEEFWASQATTVSAGTTSNITLTRNNPYATSISFTNLDTGTAITPGDVPVFAGTKVQATIVIRNNTSSTFPVRVRLVLDKNQDTVFDYSFFKVIDLSGNGSTQSVTFEFFINGLAEGQLHYAYEVAASVAGSYIRTDSSPYTPFLHASRINSIYDSIPCPVRNGCPSPSTRVFIQRDIAATINPEKKTWVIIHGRINASTDDWVTALAGAIKGDSSAIGDQILLIDWREAADDSGFATTFTGEDWIIPISQWVAAKLTGYGFTSEKVNLVGHSWGANMCAEIAERMPNATVNSIIALDPARNAFGYYDPDKEQPYEVDFARNSGFSWAFHSSSMFGSDKTPTLADESFFVYTPASTRYDIESGKIAHRAAYLAFTYFLNHPDTLSSHFKLQNLLEPKTRPWKRDLISVVTTGKTFSGYEAQISADDLGNPLALTYYKKADSLLETLYWGNQIDSVAPVVSINNPAGNSYSTAVPQIGLSGIAFDDTAVSDVKWTNNRGGSGMATGTSVWSVDGINLLAGQNILTVTARDASANTGTDVITITYTQPDVILPTVSINAPTTGVTYVSSSSLLSIGGSASDDQGIARITWSNSRGGSGIASGTLNWTVSGIPLLNGQNIITVKAWDAADNTTTDILTVSYAATNSTPPAVNITSPTTATSYTASGGSINLGGTAMDDVQVARVTWTSDRGGSGTATGTTNWTISAIALSAGQNVVTVTAWDGSNNVATDNLTVTYTPADATAPTIFIGAPTGEGTFTTGASTVNIAGTAADDFGIAQVTWSNDRGGSGTALGTNNWSVNGITLLTGVNVISVTARDAANFSVSQMLTVTYAPTVTYRVIPSSGGHGSINPQLAQDIPSGGSIVINAVPSNGYQVDHWFVNGSASQFGGDFFTLSGISSNQSVQVTFKVIPPLFYTVNVFGEGGTVTKTPNQPSYAAGSVVTLTPIANAGYQFIGWGTNAYGRSTPLEVTMSGNMNIAARFNAVNPGTTILDSIQPLTYNVAATEGTGQAFLKNPGSGILEWSAVAMTPWLRIYGARGTIPGPNGTNTLPFGWDANPTTTARSGEIRAYAPGSGGSDYQAWTIYQAAGEPPVTYTMTPIAGSNGTVTPSAAQQVVAGSNLNFTATPARAYLVDHWNLNGALAQTGGSEFAVSGVTAHGEVSVSFKISPTAVTAVTATVPESAGTISGGGVYEKGDDITLTAIPQSGYYFDRWTGGASGWTNPITLIAQNNIYHQALFRKIPAQPELVQSRFYSTSPRIFQMSLVGPASFGTGIQRSTDLLTWTDWNTANVSSNGFTSILDAAPPPEKGYYRIKPSLGGTVIALNFDDNQIPAEWNLSFLSEPRVNGGAANQRLEARQEDTTLVLSKLITAPPNLGGIRFQWNANIINSTWGMGSGARVKMKDGSTFAAQAGKRGNGFKTGSLNIYHDNPEEFFLQEFPVISWADYTLEANFSQGAIRLKGTEIATGTVAFDKSILAPSFNLEDVAAIEFLLINTSGPAAWIDDVTITLIP